MATNTKFWRKLPKSDICTSFVFEKNVHFVIGLPLLHCFIKDKMHAVSNLNVQVVERSLPYLQTICFQSLIF